jgi:hypothetical protein
MPRDGLEKEQHAYEVDHRRGDEGSEERFSAKFYTRDHRVYPRFFSARISPVRVLMMLYNGSVVLLRAQNESGPAQHSVAGLLRKRDPTAATTC